MTATQEKKLQEIEAKLMDVFLEEADPDQWAQVDPASTKESQQKARGDRYWHCKVANQTISLLTRIETYRARLRDASADGRTLPVDDEKKHAADIKAAEKKVAARLSLVKKRAV